MHGALSLLSGPFTPKLGLSLAYGTLSPPWTPSRGGGGGLCLSPACAPPLRSGSPAV